MQQKSFTVIVALGVVVALSFWTAKFVHGVVRSSYEHANSLLSDSVLVNGVRLDLSKSPSLRPLTESSNESPRTLVLVLSDTCPGVESLMPKWRDLLARLPLDGSVHVNLVSLVGQDRLKTLADFLSSRNAPHSVYLVEKLRTFALETGVNSTPYLIVLDAHHRLRRVSMGTEILAVRGVEESVRACLAGSC